MTEDKKAIIGAGGATSGKGAGTGGAGGASVPRDNLNSVQYARILELISEGEIEGFPSARNYTKDTADYNNAALKDIFIDNTPVLREDAVIGSLQDSDFNFKGVLNYLRFGTQNQTWILGFRASETPENVGSIVTYTTPVTRTITDTEVDAVRVTINLPQLQFFKADGSVVVPEALRGYMGGIAKIG